MSKEVIWSGNGEQPSGALCVRNIKSREGYDYWDRLCAIPRYGFIHSQDNSRVLKAEGVGNWIDQHAAQEVVDEAQSEVNQLRAENKALIADREAYRKALENLATVPGCGCSFPCRCGGEEWTRAELEGRMDYAAETLARAALRES